MIHLRPFKDNWAHKLSYFVCTLLISICLPQGNGFVNAAEYRYGAYLSIFGDPHPSDFGVNLALNLSSRTRIGLGYAWPDQWVEGEETGKTSACGATLKYRILGSAPVSFYLGTGLTYTWIHENRSTFSLPNGLSIPLSFEITFQSRSGLEYGAGVKATVYPTFHDSRSAHIGFFF